MSSRKIEMHWICSSCGTRNLGRHKKCQHCGDPKDASEKWLMPEDTSAAPTVTDPALLRQASAGADWQCSFCKSHQRRIDGACANCGAAQTEGARVPAGGAHPVAAMPMYAAPKRWIPARVASKPWWLLLSIPVVLFGLCGGGLCLAGALHDPPPPELRKPVAIATELGAVRWEHTIHVERYRIVDEEGFAETKPADAMDVVSQGQRHHHDEQVLDHYETETYQEQVPYQDTETYTDREQCGEDCTTTPEHCSESCSADDNGFATCTTTCSGGGQSCSPRYCSVQRTRQVTRYRSETRTREVPRYRSEPRFAEFFTWRAWRWRPARDVSASGDGSEAPRWPADAELAPPEPLGEGEQERFTRDARYTIELVGQGGQRYPYTPRSLEEYQRVQRHRCWFIGDPSRGLRLIKPPFPEPIETAAR